MYISFLGDTAIPVGYNFDSSCFCKRGIGVLNLEGSMADHHTNASLYSSNVVVNYLKEFNIKAVTLANNHIFDNGSDVSSTILKLKMNAISPFGIKSRNDEEINDYCIIKNKEMDFVLIGFGWKAIGCRSSKLYRMNYHSPKSTFEKFLQIKNEYPDKQIIAFMHWGYELEIAPHPMDRVIARKLIDAGAHAIIGCHSHCVQGMEIYKDRLIVYSLGNWILPIESFLDGKLIYPNRTKLSLVVSVGFGDDEGKYIFDYYNVSDNKILLVDSYVMGTKEAKSFLSDRYQYFLYNNSLYLEWFKENRVKKKFLPIFMSDESELSHRIKVAFILFRQWIISSLLRLGLKKGING